MKFQWNGTLYQYTCLPNGLSCGSRKFTKILKPPLASLHTKGHIISGHLDDFYLQGKTPEECRQNIIDTVILFTRLGFLVHPEKSILIPSQKLIILGFEINSVFMTVRLTRQKAQAINLDCEHFPQKSKITLTTREVAQIVGKLVSSFPGVLHGPLYYRNLEKDKSTVLANNKGNFDACMKLSTQAIAELTWWSLNILDAYKPISHREASMVLTTDASKKGWGAECEGVSTGRLWPNLEANEDINYLELLATFLGLKTFAHTVKKISVFYSKKYWQLGRQFFLL